MSEGAAHEILRDSIGNLCDCWLQGEINDQEYVRLVAMAAQQWLDDQIANSPKA